MDLQVKSLENLHEPVLSDEVLEAIDFGNLALSKRKVRIIDATLGLGGHTKEFIAKGADVLAIDADRESLDLAYKRIRRKFEPLGYKGRACPTPESETFFRGPSFILEKFSIKKELKKASPLAKKEVLLVHGNFRYIDEFASVNGYQDVDAVLFDLGLSSYQLSVAERGFSFQEKDSLLDMRFDNDLQAVTAADLLNSLDHSQLTELFSAVLGKKTSSKLAESTIFFRQSRKIETVGDYLEIVQKATHTRKKIHPATLPFLALRMAVNSELESLEEALPKAYKLLGPKGKLLVISFHSGEDKIVKSFIKKVQVKSSSGKYLTPGKKEVVSNPRSRSAKLRIITKNEI